MSTQGLVEKGPGTQATRMSTQQLIAESQSWLDIVSEKELSRERKERISAETVDNFSFYYNRAGASSSGSSSPTPRSATRWSPGSSAGASSWPAH
jgi:hypothetical protein